MATCNTSTLLESAKCFSCLSKKELQAVIAQLLCNIAADAAAGAACCNLNGHGSPVGVVTPTAINQFYRDESANALWQSTGLTNADWINWL